MIESVALTTAQKIIMGEQSETNMNEKYNEIEWEEGIQMFLSFIINLLFFFLFFLVSK